MPANIYTYDIGTFHEVQNTNTSPQGFSPLLPVKMSDVVSIKFNFGGGIDGNVDGCTMYSVRFDVEVESEGAWYEHYFDFQKKTDQTPNDRTVIFTRSSKQPTRVPRRWNPNTYIPRKVLNNIEIYRYAGHSEKKARHQL